MGTLNNQMGPNDTLQPTEGGVPLAAAKRREHFTKSIQSSSTLDQQPNDGINRNQQDDIPASKSKRYEKTLMNLNAFFDKDASEGRNHVDSQIALASNNHHHHMSGSGKHGHAPRRRHSSHVLAMQDNNDDKKEEDGEHPPSNMLKSTHQKKYGKLIELKPPPPSHLEERTPVAHHRKSLTSAMEAPRSARTPKKRASLQDQGKGEGRTLPSLMGWDEDSLFAFEDPKFEDDSSRRSNNGIGTARPKPKGGLPARRKSSADAVKQEQMNNFVKTPVRRVATFNNNHHQHLRGRMQRHASCRNFKSNVGHQKRWELSRARSPSPVATTPTAAATATTSSKIPLLRRPPSPLNRSLTRRSGTKSRSPSPMGRSMSVSSTQGGIRSRIRRHPSNRNNKEGEALDHSSNDSMQDSSGRNKHRTATRDRRNSHERRIDLSAAGSYRERTGGDRSHQRNRVRKGTTEDRTSTHQAARDRHRNTHGQQSGSMARMAMASAH